MTNARTDALETVTKTLNESAAATAFGALLRSGCDREELLELFVRLRRAEVRRARTTKTLKKLAKTLREASAGVADLTTWGESGNLGLPDDPRTWLLSFGHDLELLADAIRERAAAERNQVDLRLERARKRIVREVMQRTDRTHDEQVAVLIGAVLGWDDYSVQQHRAWRSLNIVAIETEALEPERAEADKERLSR